MRATASASRALAPSPYTVSVGKATRRPARRSLAARSISPGATVGAIDDCRLWKLDCELPEKRRLARKAEMCGLLGIYRAWLDLAWLGLDGRGRPSPHEVPASKNYFF